MLIGALACIFISRVGVAEDAHEWVVGEDALEAFVRFGRSVADNTLPGVLGETDPHAAAVMVVYRLHPALRS